MEYFAFLWQRAEPLPCIPRGSVEVWHPGVSACPVQPEQPVGGPGFQRYKELSTAPLLPASGAAWGEETSHNTGITAWLKIRTLFCRWYWACLPPVDVLLLEGFAVKLRPGTQLVQPWQHLLGRPAGHRFADQRIVLIIDTGAPVQHQQHHLGTHTHRLHPQRNSSTCSRLAGSPWVGQLIKHRPSFITYQSEKKEMLSSIYSPTGTQTHCHVAKYTVTLLSGSTWTK